MKSTAQPRMSRVFSLFIGNLLVLTFGLGSLLGQGVQPKVSLLGVPGISTIAGSANSGYSGDGAAATLATFALALIPGSLLYRGAFIALALPVFALVTWFLVLSPEERHFVKEVPVRL